MRNDVRQGPAVAFAVAVALAAALVAPGDSGAQPRPAGRTRVVMLGTGNPNADPDRSGPAVAVIVDDRPYLVDAGPGVVRRAASAVRAGQGALAAERLGIVFLTHLHSDHTVGLPDLIFTHGSSSARSRCASSGRRVSRR
ncbi:MAG: MBL fold metallo-hydrolase [Gemmatimonadota bacterium]